MTLLRRGLVAMAIVVGGASVAHADPARDRAASAYEDARKAYDSGAYQAAAVGFERVFHEVPNGPSLVAAGRAWERAGELGRAADDYRDALSFTDLRADDVATARERLAALEKETARLEVLAPEGATVSVGHAERVGTPVTVHVLPPSITVVARLVDGTEKSLTTTVEAGRVASLDFRPPAAPVLPHPERPETGSRAMRTAAWITAGSAVVVLAASGILALEYESANSSWDKSPRTDQSQHDGVAALQTGTNVAFFGGCLLAASSVTLFAVSLRGKVSGAPSPAVAPVSSLTLGPRGVGLQGTF
jgi:hypothetical protein